MERIEKEGEDEEKKKRFLTFESESGLFIVGIKLC
jgi:hypothetical protein